MARSPLVRITRDRPRLGDHHHPFLCPHIAIRGTGIPVHLFRALRYWCDAICVHVCAVPQLTFGRMGSGSWDQCHTLLALPVSAVADTMP
jgi:hypothetical protein